MNRNYDLNNINEIASSIIENAKNKTLLFYGEMGVGKTTLIKEICIQLKVEDVVSSPTFSLVNEYYSESKGKIFHFDFYRINDEEEALDIGIEDYFYNNKWCLVEWPQNIKNLLPLDAVEVHITILDNNKRNIQLK